MQQSLSLRHCCRLVWHCSISYPLNWAAVCQLSAALQDFSAPCQAGVTEQSLSETLTAVSLQRYCSMLPVAQGQTAATCGCTLADGAWQTCHCAISILLQDFRSGQKHITEDTRKNCDADQTRLLDTLRALSGCWLKHVKWAVWEAFLHVMMYHGQTFHVCTCV